MMSSKPFIRPAGNRRPARAWARRGSLVGFAVLVAVASALSVSWRRARARFDPEARAATAFARERYHVALRGARTFLESHPGDPEAHLMAARCLARLAQPELAERHFALAGPLGRPAIHERALGLVFLNRPTEAAAIYDDLLSRDPTDASALKRLAAVRLGQGQAREVVPLAQRLLKIPGEEAAGQTLLAYALHQGKHFTQAVAAAERAIELDPELRTIHIPRTLFYTHLALDLMGLGRDEEARTHLEHALERDDDPGLKELLGVACQRLGLDEDAERYWRRALEQDPGNADAWLDLGRLAMTRRDWREAVRCFQHAGDLSPLAVEPFYQLSLAHQLLGDLTKSRESRARADANRDRSGPKPGGMGEPDDSHAPNPRGSP